MLNLRFPLNPVLFLCCCLIIACTKYSDNTSRSKERQITISNEQPESNDLNEEISPGLQNLLKIAHNIYSGGEPSNNAAFISLVCLGITTIVSVDGAQPDIESASRYNLRYIHIPIGYDGIEEKAALSLTRLVKEVEGPFYIHCHHGVHRGPAAAAIAAIAEGDIDNKEAYDILELAGTSENYAGLWRDVENFQVPDQNVKLPDLVEKAEVSSFAAAMAEIDRSYDNLKLCRNANWNTPPGHPDLLPIQVALLLKERLREASRNLTRESDEQFRMLLLEAEHHAQKIEELLHVNDLVSSEEKLLNLKQDCKSCHQKYRN